jgi:hypothetical protein
VQLIANQKPLVHCWPAYCHPNRRAYQVVSKGRQQPAAANERRRRIENLATSPREAHIELSMELFALHTAARHPQAKGSKRAAEVFRGLIDSGVVKRRRAYYLIKIGQLLHDGTITPAKAAEIGWTRLQIIADRMTGKNTAKLLRLALDNSAQELKRIKRQDDQKPTRRTATP